MTVGDLLERLLTHFSPEERDVPDADAYPGRNAAACGAINQALQTLFSEGGPWCRTDYEGYLLYAPATITVSATTGSKTITTADWSDWMAGCTIRITGASVDNRIHGKHADTAVITLTSPFDGTTGFLSATVYHDSIDLPSSVAKLLAPVRIRGARRLSPVSHPGALVPGYTDSGDYDHHRNSTPIQTETEVSASSGTPVFYCVTTHQADVYAVPTNRLRFYPATNQQRVLEARVRYAAPVYDYSTDLESEIPVPHEHTESLLRPLAEYHLLSCPFFRNDQARQQIRDDYMLAIRAMQRLTPQGQPAMHLRSQF